MNLRTALSSAVAASALFGYACVGDQGAEVVGVQATSQALSFDASLADSAVADGDPAEAAPFLILRTYAPPGAFDAGADCEVVQIQQSGDAALDVSFIEAVAVSSVDAGGTQ